jgi:hypothetical protein
MNKRPLLQPETENVVHFCLTVWGVAFVLACLALTLSGCGGPPQSISIDPTASPEVRAAIEDARDAWCETDGWCPITTFDGELHIVIDHPSEPLPPPGTHMAGGHTPHQDSAIHLDGRVLEAQPDMTWILAAHELGHAHGIDHHGKPGCTMFYLQDGPRFAITCE